MFPKLAELAAVVGLFEIGVVEDVEEFGVELEAEAFAWTEGEVL